MDFSADIFGIAAFVSVSGRRFGAALLDLGRGQGLHRLSKAHMRVRSVLKVQQDTSKD
jgi:hypothetical protein